MSAQPNDFFTQGLRLRGDIDRSYHVISQRVGDEFQETLGPVSMDAAVEAHDDLVPCTLEKGGNVEYLAFAFTPLFDGDPEHVAVTSWIDSEDGRSFVVPCIVKHIGNRVVDVRWDPEFARSMMVSADLNPMDVDHEMTIIENAKKEFARKWGKR